MNIKYQEDYIYMCMYVLYLFIWSSNKSPSGKVLVSLSKLEFEANFSGTRKVCCRACTSVFRHVPDHASAAPTTPWEYLVTGVVGKHGKLIFLPGTTTLSKLEARLKPWVIPHLPTTAIIILQLCSDKNSDIRIIFEYIC